MGPLAEARLDAVPRHREQSADEIRLERRPMLLGGLWHGANWNFVIWGGLHGTYLVGYHRWKEWRERLFFRSHDLATTSAYLIDLFSFQPGGEGAILPVLVLALLTMCIDVPQALSDNEQMLVEWRPVMRAAFVAGGVLLLLLGGNIGNEPFIYFQF